MAETVVSPYVEVAPREPEVLEIRLLAADGRFWEVAPASRPLADALDLRLFGVRDDWVVSYVSLDQVIARCVNAGHGVYVHARAPTPDGPEA